MANFFRQFQHLLPQSVAWRLTIQKTLRSFFVGLAGAPSGAKDFVDGVWGDLFPGTTRELTEWERTFGIETDPVDANRRTNIATEWAATGGESPSYIQGVLQAAGFSVYVYEWWASGPPWVARDPRTYTSVPLTGTVQCGETWARCGEPAAQCNDFLANDPKYFQNDTLSKRAPPPIPSDPSAWPYFLYIAGATFPTPASVPIGRREQLRRLILKLKPAQDWVVLLVNYTPDPWLVTSASGANLVVQGANQIVTHST